MMWVVDEGGEVGEEVLRRREAPTRKREYGPINGTISTHSLSSSPIPRHIY
jgi:hypothetical protein